MTTEAAIADLLAAVDSLEPVRLAREVRKARGPVRVALALRLAVAALDVSGACVDGADKC